MPSSPLSDETAPLGARSRRGDARAKPYRGRLPRVLPAGAATGALAACEMVGDPVAAAVPPVDGRGENLHYHVGGGLHEIGDVGEDDEGGPEEHLGFLATHGSSLRRRRSPRRGNRLCNLGRFSHRAPRALTAQVNRSARATSLKIPRNTSVGELLIGRGDGLA